MCMLWVHPVLHMEAAILAAAALGVLPRVFAWRWHLKLSATDPAETPDVPWACGGLFRKTLQAALYPARAGGGPGSLLHP